MKLFKNLTEACQQREVVQALKITVKDQSFPQNLLDFPNLDELYLEGNCIEFPTTAPSWAGLKILSIKWPMFKGDLSAVFSLKALENLKIIETPFNTFKLPLGHAAAPLKSLTLKDCGIAKLPEEFSMLTHLTELNLSGNNLERLPASFIQFKNLKRLNLDQNNFTKFPDAIKSMPDLSHLSIDGNNFSEDEKSRIQKEFHIWVS
ncbi:MAG TPA: leucine-rich repeat domain-containing protein [Bacteriovoracaceae bacterium]|nr:leucine-rich repeat domain-containing protein [Bacteriovoracaceae bacterium]